MTNEEYAQLIANVQTKIADIIASVATEAKIHKRFVIDTDDGKWAALLKNSSGKIHAFSVSFAGRRSVERREIPIGCIQPILKLSIIGFYGYDFGTDTVNSEKKCRDEMAALDLTFEKKYDLDLSGIVERHEGFTYEVKNSFLSGNRLHITRTTLEVKLNPIWLR